MPSCTTFHQWSSEIKDNGIRGEHLLDKPKQNPKLFPSYFQDILEELSFFESRIAEMRVEAERVSAVSSPEVAADMNATIDSLVHRFTALQHAAEQRKQQLMEAGELQGALEQKVDRVTAWTDSAQSLATATTTMTSPVQVRARVEEHKVQVGGNI